MNKYTAFLSKWMGKGEFQNKFAPKRMKEKHQGISLSLGG